MLCIWLMLAWAALMAVGLLQLISAVLVAVGLSLTYDPFEGYSLSVFVFVIAALSWVALLYSHKIALLMPRTRQITTDRDPYLYSVASEQAQLVSLPVPKVIESPFFNASAIGRSPRHAVLAVSPTLQCILDRRELGAVLAHEMAHVRNGDNSVMTVAVTVIGFILGVSMLVGFHGWIGAIVLLLSVMSWHREFRADRTAAHVCGDSIVLASALGKLSRSGFLSFIDLPITHPPTKLRVWCLKRLAKRST